MPQRQTLAHHGVTEKKDPISKEALAISEFGNNLQGILSAVGLLEFLPFGKDREASPSATISTEYPAATTCLPILSPNDPQARDQRKQTMRVIT